MDESSIDIQALEQLLADGQYSKAIEVCEAAQLNEDLPRKFWFCKAKAFEGIGDVQRAIECYRCEIASLSRVPPVLIGYVGSLLLQVGKYSDAAVCLRAS